MGINCGSGGQAWWKEAKGENWDNCNNINNEYLNKISKNKINKC